jgi:SAM-dependent methyltransferase
MTHGVRQIVRFNWPFYVASAGALAIGVSVAFWLPLGPAIRALTLSGLGVAAFWLLASLTASWVVYDLSALMRWQWILRALGLRPRTWINIHAGLDESTPALRALLPESTGRVFDIYDPAEMTEPSIARARALARNEIDPEPADFHRLPPADGTVDAALLLLSAHELRTDAARGALFREIRRVLAPSGRVIVAEHPRNWANFLAFGPGFLHFHSLATWRRSFASARLAIRTEFSLTPFVRIFVLEKPS